jgi:predicted acylesterase/phospholipase RssA
LPPKASATDPESAWWLWVTIAEAYLGLLKYDAATATLKKALQLPNVYAWQRESTARQLAYLAHVIASRNEANAQQAFDVIQNGFSLSGEAREGICLGRIGLALSGGGFRASLFHIGVLARLAELDLLRHVEVISCVSGGSIIGAYYYLELRSRMLALTDLEMTQDEYIAIVKQVEERFLKGVQTNLRSSIATNLWCDLRMIFDPRYSRSTRIGDLYQSRLFDKAGEPALAKPEWVSDLAFVPKGADRQFNPKSHNWTRGSKLPMLVLNATTLNTGHNWQFTATWMGEAATTIDNRIDGNDYLRRMYYSEAPAAYKKGVRLGHAVAASACVPGLFPALKLPKLYERHPVVRLVDGGVHDNQGIAALLDQECSVIIVSDASGQMRSVENPPGGVFGGPARANSVLQARVRLAQYRELDARKRGGALRGLMWVHLREELEPDAIDWTGCLDRFSREDEGLPKKEEEPFTGYGVHREIQDALARLRTDLDSFSDAEAHALMCSAYLMTRLALQQHDSPLSNRTEKPSTWRFMKVKPHLKSPEAFRVGVPRAAGRRTAAVQGLAPLAQARDARRHPADRVGIGRGLRARRYRRQHEMAPSGYTAHANRRGARNRRGDCRAGGDPLGDKKLRPRRRVGRAEHDWSPHCADVRTDVDPPDNLRSDLPPVRQVQRGARPARWPPLTGPARCASGRAGRDEFVVMGFQQEIRALLTARRLLLDKLRDVELSLRGILRGSGLKLDKVTQRGFETRVCELVANPPMLQQFTRSMLLARDAAAGAQYAPQSASLCVLGTRAFSRAVIPIGHSIHGPVALWI